MMGEARRRGTHKQRIAAAVKRNKKIAKHYHLTYKELTHQQITHMNNVFTHLTPQQQAEVTGPPILEEKT